MTIKKVEDIIAWQKAQDFAVDIYEAFASSKDYGFKDQIQRAVVSISNNIAEGFSRQSDKEFVRFLYIANASCSEVKSMLYLGERLGKISVEIKTEFIGKAAEISKVIQSFIRAICELMSPLVI